MKLSGGTDYAVHTLVYLVGVRGRRPVQTGEISCKLGISPSYLSKVVQSLVRAGLVESRRGVGGGLRLARSPDEINLGDVVRAMEGPGPLYRCYRSPAPGNRGCACPINDAILEAEDRLYDRLSQVSLSDLSGGFSGWRERCYYDVSNSDETEATAESED